MTPRIHFFPLADLDSARLFCGEFRDGDGWSTLPQAITCPECGRRLAGSFEAKPVQESASVPKGRERS